MKRLSTLICGLVVAFGASWLALVAYPYFQLGRMQAVLDPNSGEVVPPILSGLALEGEKIYAANGCVSCHTQDVRSSPLFSDVRKELGPRPMVARDYLRYQPALVGTIRIGPDLANVGLHHSDPHWFHCHLFEPASMTPGSVMPSYRFLYETKKIQGERSHSAVRGLVGPYAPKPGFEVLPTHEAEALVAYLLSLKRNYPLPEAEPLPTP